MLKLTSKKDAPEYCLILQCQIDEILYIVEEQAKEIEKLKEELIILQNLYKGIGR